MDGSIAARKTAYAANQHSISIIGSDIGRTHLPSNLANINQNPNQSPKHPQNEIAGPGDKIPRSPPGGHRPTALVARHSPTKTLQVHTSQEETL